MLSILAGFMIAISAAIYLNIGGIIGACCFSLGLITIVLFGAELFTGKAGLLATGEIGAGKLCKIWCGNLFGTMLGSMTVL